MQLLKLVCFASILGYASYFDIKTHTVQKRTYFLLLLTGLLHVSPLSFWGFVVTGIPLLVAWFVLKGFGAGDVKYSALCGFVLQGYNGLFAVVIGLILSVIVAPILYKIKGVSVRRAKIPLIPFLSTGCIIVSILSM